MASSNELFDVFKALAADPNLDLGELFSDEEEEAVGSGLLAGTGVATPVAEPKSEDDDSKTVTHIPAAPSIAGDERNESVRDLIDDSVQRRDMLGSSALAGDRSYAKFAGTLLFLTAR